MLRNLHPELLPRLATGGLVCIIASHVRIVDLERLLHRLRVQVENTVQDDLRFLHIVDAFDVYFFVSQVLRLFLLSGLVLYFSLTNVDRVIDLEEDRLALLLVCFFSLQVLDEVFKVLAMDEHVEGQVVDRLCSRMLKLDTELCEEVSSLLVGPVWDFVHRWHQRFKRDVPKAIGAESLDSLLWDLFEKDWCIDFHLLTANLLILDHLNVHQGLGVLITVQVVND